MNMEHDEIIASWNKQADYLNRWNTLGEDEKLEWAIKLEREACAKLCDELFADVPPYSAPDCAAAIRERGQG